MHIGMMAQAAYTPRHRPDLCHAVAARVIIVAHTSTGAIRRLHKSSGLTANPPLPPNDICTSPKPRSTAGRSIRTTSSRRAAPPFDDPMAGVVDSASRADPASRAVFLKVYPYAATGYPARPTATARGDHHLQDWQAPRRAKNRLE